MSKCFAFLKPSTNITSASFFFSMLFPRKGHIGFFFLPSI